VAPFTFPRASEGSESPEQTPQTRAHCRIGLSGLGMTGSKDEDMRETVQIS
jgi:hypothetical protein